MENQSRKRLNDVAEHAERLMDTLGRQVLGHPLQRLGWTFGFDRAKRRLGCCTWKKDGRLAKRVTVSRYLVVLHGLDYEDEAGLPVIDDVIRHEIAHAIDYEQRGVSYHDNIWKAICRRVGADPARLYDGRGLARVPGKYVATCPNCGLTTHFYRRPRRKRACKPCCREHNGGRYAERFELTVRERATDRLVRIRR